MAPAGVCLLGLDSRRDGSGSRLDVLTVETWAEVEEERPGHVVVTFSLG